MFSHSLFLQPRKDFVLFLSPPAGLLGWFDAFLFLQGLAEKLMICTDLCFLAEIKHFWVFPYPNNITDYFCCSSLWCEFEPKAVEATISGSNSEKARLSESLSALRGATNIKTRATELTFSSTGVKLYSLPCIPARRDSRFCFSETLKRLSCTLKTQITVKHRHSRGEPGQAASVMLDCNYTHKATSLFIHNGGHW